MTAASERRRTPKKNGGSLKYVFILACVAIAWFAMRSEERPDRRAADSNAGNGAKTAAPVAHLTTSTFTPTVARGVHVVDFWAEWCGPCRAQGPIIDAFAKRNSGRVGVGKVDVDAEGELAERFEISSIPTIIVFRDGKEEARFVGVTSEDDLASAVNPLL